MRKEVETRLFELRQYRQGSLRKKQSSRDQTEQFESCKDAVRIKIRGNGRLKSGGD